MRFLLLAFCLIVANGLMGQGTTSSDMRGIITDANGEPVIGATVTAIHVPSGSTYGTATNVEGNYQLPGMRVGGPYTVTVSYTGYSSIILENVELRLGETYRHDFTLSEANIQLDAVMVVASSGVTGQSAGTSTNISADKIATVPSLNRDVTDYLRLSPQANSFGDGISFAGINNRYNAIYIDGAVNNDVYGLASSGTNGGQTGISPFSIDIIDQFQIVLSPYDVSLGGFAGGGINAVTKSGTNKLSATAYYFLQNEGLAGKTNFKLAQRLYPGNPDSIRTKLANFSKNIYGASFGGPIKKDKIFFFANVEIQKDQTPIPFETAQYTSVADRAQTTDLDNLRNYLINTYNYDPGGYGDTKDELKGLKLFGKLDFNLGNNSKLTIRHQYTKAEQYDRNSGSTTTINFNNDGYFFPSTTNSSAVELKSRFGQNASNDLILGFTKVKDDRGTIGSNFPFVVIQDKSNGTIRFGTEEFSTSNLLDQSTFTLTDNLKLYKGNHTFTFGTNDEFYSFNNIFIGQNFGSYTFASLNDFLTGVKATSYVRSYSLVDEASGDATKAAAKFNAMQLGVYAQDEWTLSSKFTLTGGVRVDVPIITTDPKEDVVFNDTLSVFQAAYPVAKDAVAGKAPDGQIMISPRLGFELDVNGHRKTIIRGGVGIFTSRIPFVWPGAMFTNNGLTIGRVTQADLGGSATFVADVNNQYTNPNFAIPSGEVDL
ncbi:MAG: carboxypeptidase regulatory-like domain-containing protein, partial [Saprospiraceae bacterium]